MVISVSMCLEKRRGIGAEIVVVLQYMFVTQHKIPSSGSENVLIKLNRTFFGLDRDVVTTFSYCVPEYSSYQLREQHDIFGDIEHKLSCIGSDCDKLCFGDFNSRTGNKPDYIISEDNTDIPVPCEIYETDSVATAPRSNLDTVTNKYGDILLQLCKAVPLRICNGRKLGDILGSFTCITPNGQSCVDYCLASPKLYNNVRTLKVGDPVLTLSDHCPISINLKVNVNRMVHFSNYEFITKPPNLPWNEDISFRFENMLQTPEFSDRIHSFNGQTFSCDQSGVDEATKWLTEGALRSDISETMRPY